MASGGDPFPAHSGSDSVNSLHLPIESPRPESGTHQRTISGRRPRPKVPEDRRKRTRRACDECRKRKEKCDGKPACGRCFRYRIMCQYNGAKTTRARSNDCDAQGVAGAGTDKNDGGVPGALVDSAKLRCLERILAHYLGGRSLHDHEIRDLAASLPEPHGQVQVQNHGSCSSSPTSYSVTRLHSTNSPVTPNEKPREPYEDMSLNAFTRTIKSAIVEKLPSGIPGDTDRLESAARREHSWDTDLEQDALHAAWSCFPPRQFAVFLLDVFFRYLQTSIYYVEETWAYQCLENYYSLNQGVAPDNASNVCTILMVMACGTQFAHLESFHLTEQMAEDDETLQHFSEDDIGQTFHRAARTLLPFVLTFSSFYSVQACLMMATYNFPLDAAGASYVYLSFALSLAVEQGMYRQEYYSRLTSIESEVQKRVWWTVFTLHLQASIRHGRPKYLRGSEVDVAKPVDLPELRPRQEVSNFANLKGHIELLLITEAVSDEIAALRKTNRSMHFLKLLLIRQQLLKWWDSFPGTDRILTPATNPRQLRNNIHLRLYYCSTRMSLGRPFLLSTVASVVSPDGAGTQELLGSESLIQDSVDAAMEVLNLCQTLRDRVGLARASYVTEFTSCRTAMLVLLAQSLSKPDAKIRQALSQGLEVMKIMAIGNPLAKSEVRVIEVLERAVLRLKAAVKTQDANDSRIRDKSNYDAFQTWARLWQPSSGFTPMESSFSPNSTGILQQSSNRMQSDPTTANPNFQHDLVSPYPGDDVGWGSFPLELSQFDIIPGLELSNTSPACYDQWNPSDLSGLEQ